MEPADSAPSLRSEPSLEAVEETVHRCTTTDEIELALTRVQAASSAPEATPVVLVHGTYANRTFWMTEDGFGLAPFLAREGFDVWIAELRGHGRSPKGEAFGDFTAEDHIRRDLPIVHEAVLDRTGASPLWVGHSAGGLYLLGALSRGWIDPGEVQAVAVFGTQISQGEAYLKHRLVAGAIKATINLIGRFPAPALGMGSEPEPPEEMKEIIDWKAKDRWVDRSGASYRQGLADLEFPFRAYAGAGDETDPPEGCKRLFDEVGSEEKSYQLLSTDEGFARDYGHVEMIASRGASRDVWPNLAAWLAQYT